MGHQFFIIGNTRNEDGREHLLFGKFEK